jgi:hypothetical protein
MTLKLVFIKDDPEIQAYQAWLNGLLSDEVDTLDKLRYWLPQYNAIRSPDLLEAWTKYSKLCFTDLAPVNDETVKDFLQKTAIVDRD